MKLPAKLAEIVSQSIADKLINEHIVEADDEQKFRHDILEIIKKAVEEEKELEEEAEKLVERHIK